jgi:uncharacterized membrane protein
MKNKMRRAKVFRKVFQSIAVTLLALLALLVLPGMALAGPRSGGSFGGRSFPSGGGFSMPRSNYSSPGFGYGGGSHFIFAPGWGWGGFGFGGGGLGIFGTLMLLSVVGYGALAIARAVRRARQGGDGDGSSGWGSSYDDASEAMSGRAYVYKLQIGLGRSGRGIQQRLEEFAGAGDTATEAGLAALLQQSALELLRQKDSIRYAGADASGPMSLTNAETRMNGLALAERSRFTVERVRAADGRVVRSQETAEEGKEALEMVLVTLIVATRTPLGAIKTSGAPEDIEAALSQLGGVSPSGLLGLEVIWTPADPNDSMTETDLMTTYPELMRSV